MINYTNYFLTSKNSRLIYGHIKAEDLYQKILDHDGSTAYCCYFDLDEKLLKLEWDTGKKDKDEKTIYEYHLSGQTPKNPNYKCNGKTFTQYEGICRPALNMVSFDFDSADPQESLDDVREFVAWLDVDDLVVFFSGSKGFHVMVPFGYFDLEPNEHLPNQLKDLAKHLKTIYPTLDDSIYNYNRKFRVPFTQHEKGLYKQTVNVKWEMHDIIQAANEPLKEDFLNFTTTHLKPLQVITDALEQSKRKSYEIETERAGTIEKPSNFEKFDNKLCIKKMLDNRCDDVGRNNACIRIVNDFYRVGTPQSICEEFVMKWAANNGLSITEAGGIVVSIYQRGSNYNFGCQDEIKAAFCSAKCDIWKKLDPEKRPVVVDAPTSSEIVGKSEIAITKKILEDIFHCKFDDSSQDFYDGFIAKQGEKDLFIYKDKYWQYVDEALTDKLKRKINQLANGKLSIKKIESTFKMIRTYVPNSERDLFTPKTNAAGFKNGTLYLQEDEKGKFYLEFKSMHFPKDYLTHKFDFDYVEDISEENDMFTDLCERMFEGDDDKDAKINALSEMYGAALMPYFPHLFFLCGKAQSGKSTFMLILNEMLNEEDHICSVQPKDWKNFNMEPMINKLVNMVTDVNTKKPIEDDVVKQIEDRVPVSINRKGKSVIRAPLPALHVFAGNDFMKSEDGSSKAMQRRWTVIRFDKTYEGRQMRNFAHVCYQNNPQGVVNFALKGLLRLVDQQGYFTKFESSKRELESWGKESDIVAQFIEELEEDGFEDCSANNDAWIKRVELYSFFKNWQEASGYIKQLIPKQALYKALSQKGYALRKKNGVWGFRGFGTSQDVSDSESCNDDTV